MFRRFIVPAVLTLLVALVAAPVLAQGQEEGQGRQRGQRGQRGFGFGGFGMGGGYVGLLFNEQVQTEIELLDEQKAELTQLQEDMQAQMQEQFQGFGDLQNLSEEERNARFAEMREQAEARQKEMQAKIEGEILLPPQVERLKQINVQVRGVQALNDEEVAEALGITDDQKTELTAIQEEFREKMGELFPGFGQGGQGGQRRQLSEEEQTALREKMTVLRTESNEKQLNVLTDEQKAQFEQMKGEPVSFDVAELQGGRGFGRGGFGQGGRGGRGRNRGGDGNQDQGQN